MDLLLASKFRLHEFFLDKFGENHIAVNSFEEICADCGVTRRTICYWGKLIHEEVKKRNEFNLGVACGVPKDAALEISNLKSTVASLKNEVVESKGMMVQVLQALNDLKAMRVTDLPPVAANAAVPGASATSLVGTVTVSPAISRQSGSSLPLSIQNDRPTVAAVEPVSVVDRMMNAPARIVKKTKPSSIEVSKKEEILPMALSTFLSRLAENGINPDNRNTAIFSVSIDSTMKRRVLLAFHYACSCAGDNLVGQYRKLGQQYRMAKINKQSDLKKSLFNDLLAVCHDIAKAAKEEYIAYYEESESYKSSKQKKTSKDRANTAASTLSLGSRLEKMKWTY